MLTTDSITTKRVIAEKIEPDTFKPPCHRLEKNIATKLEKLLKKYKSQFAQDETTIGTTPLTKMTIDTRDSELVSQKPYPIAMKHYKWAKDEINKLLTTKVNTYHSGTKGKWSKMSSSWLSCTKQDCQKINLPYAKIRRHFFPTEWCKILLDFGSMSRISPHFIGWIFNT